MVKKPPYSVKLKVKDNTGELRPCSWEEAIVTVAKVMDSTPGDKIGAVVGGMADAEVRCCAMRN